MKKLFQNILELKKALGVSIHFTSQNEYNISYCLLSRKKGLIDIESFGDIEYLKDLGSIASGSPLFLNISGKVVIEKVLDFSENKNYIRAAFPSNTEYEFMFQVFEQTTKTVVSIIRKDKAESLITEIKSLSLLPIGLSIGLASSSKGISAIETFDNETLILFDKGIQFLENEIISLQNETELFKDIFIEQKKFNAGQFIAFSTGLNAFYEKNDQIGVLEVLEFEKKDHFQKTIFDKLKLGIPLFFLICLLINFAFYLMALKENGQLLGTDIQNNGIVESLDKLKTEIENKENFLKNSNWLAQSKVSYYSDQIGLLIPNQIGLTVLDVFPATLVKKNNTKSYSFSNKEIKIEGVSESLKSVNDWKQTLQKQKWIKDVELISYLQDNQRKDISFELKLTLF